MSSPSIPHAVQASSGLAEVNIWLEIQRLSGIDLRKVEADGLNGIVEGACPGCGATPFMVQGRGRHRHSRDTFRAPGIAKCCGDSVGYIYAKANTLFGLEEDEAVLNGLARVY